MKYAICIAKNGGYMFNNRRVSMDSQVREKLFELAEGHSVFVSAYSAKQFENDAGIRVCESFQDASENDICFVEDISFEIAEASEIILFHWNRDYPADRFFKFDPRKEGFKRMRKEEFKGTSHDKITLEVFRRNRP